MKQKRNISNEFLILDNGSIKWNAECMYWAFWNYKLSQSQLDNVSSAI